MESNVKTTVLVPNNCSNDTEVRRAEYSLGMANFGVWLFFLMCNVPFTIKFKYHFKLI